MTELASRDGLRSSRRLVVGGGVLVGIGGLLGCSGGLLLSSALVSVARRRVEQLDQPPREIARLKWRQAKATTAGAQAWRSGSQTPSPAT